MYSRRREIEYLQDILEAAERITEYINGLSFDDFLARPMVQGAVARNVQIVGEATKLVSTELRLDTRKSPGSPWPALEIGWCTTISE